MTNKINQATLIVAHGSRNEKSNASFISMVERLSRTKEFRGHIVPAFLELAKPDILSAIEECHDKGYKEIRILPYFLHAGNHVIRDIPETVDSSPLKNKLSFQILPPLGETEDIFNILIGMIIVDPGN
jgi:sirohydrochlorin cobaltochelatase